MFVIYDEQKNLDVREPVVSSHTSWYIVNRWEIWQMNSWCKCLWRSSEFLCCHFAPAFSLSLWWLSPFCAVYEYKVVFFFFSSTSFSCYFRPFQYKDCNEKLKCCPVPKVSLGGLYVSVWIWKCASVKCQLSNCKCENTALSFHQSHCVVIVILSCYRRCFHPHTAVQKRL